jgi:peroxiredoxin Q/BCP
MKSLRILTITGAIVLATSAVLCAQQPSAAGGGNASYGNAPAAAPAPAPAVGETAPDFTAPAADQNGAKATPLSLKDLRGKVVVLAFYPKDRSSGCTAELTKFRDEYDKLFGKNVVVLPVSTDDMDSHVGWAKDAHFPFALVSDPDGKIATTYGSITPGRNWDNRTVFVIAPDGKIAYSDLKFGALDQHAYDALAAAIKQAAAGS